MFTLDDLYAQCTLCATEFGVSHGSLYDVTSHLKSKTYMDESNIVHLATPITSIFRQSIGDQVIEAEVRWVTFLVNSAQHILLV